MKEIRNILVAFDQLVRSGEYGVLASVVQTSGSTYRRPGARALILPDNTIVGLIGGCLESALLEEAHNVRVSGIPQRLHYEKCSETDLIWSLGAGSAGTVDVLLERVGSSNPGPLQFIAACIEQRCRGVLATVVRTAQNDVSFLGARWMRCAGGSAEMTKRWAPPASLHAESDRILADGKSRMLCMNSTEILLECITPPIRLVIFGAGTDAVPVVRIASELGWSVEIIGAGCSLTDHFHEASSIEEWIPEQAAKEVVPDETTAVLLMTHNFNHDCELLQFLLPSAARYIGVIGPKRRLDKLLEEVHNNGYTPSTNALSRLYGPAGFDVGAESPEEIALSFICEVQAVLNGRSGKSLRKQDRPIHEHAL
ncbi:XdhC family protein [Sulfurimonas sp. HSL3-7]|uniref:XdhC family protein n=1 Tax=Sulfonitrofixus jiaomeiensis TaxID=3131938 RepID=UPI0031F73AA7